MNKIKGFFIGIFLLAAVFAMLLLTALIYRANERSSVKSYIFQMANSANQRVGVLQNLDDISAVDLRNKLIRKYVSEYFKVIPGDQDVTNRPVLDMLSSKAVFNYWENYEAKEIEKMSAKNMFRMVVIQDDGIATYNKPDNENDDDNTDKVYYMVRYNTFTWTDSNTLGIEPIPAQGTLYLEIRFEPGLRETINDDKYDIRKYLQSGKDPVGLFKFKVTNIGDNTEK